MSTAVNTPPIAPHAPQQTATRPPVRRPGPAAPSPARLASAPSPAAPSPAGAARSGSPVVATEGLTKVYGDSRAVDNVSLRVPAGGVYGFLGLKRQSR